MDVTNSNFDEIFPQVADAIKNATLIAIDTELTGLNTVRDVNSYDTLKQYYEKVRRNCKEFLVIQYGLAIFRYDEDKQIFHQQSYNFYIFRKPINRNIPDQRFLCQASSIDFLIGFGFDFNKTFKEGIPYLNFDEENSYREKIEERQKTRANQLLNSSHKNDNRVPIPSEDQHFVDKIMLQLEEFLESDELEIQIEKCNPFRRKLLYQTTAEKFENKISLETRQVDKERYLVAMRQKTVEQREQEEREKAERDSQELEQALGFSKVMRLIVESGKPVVAHNSFLDLLHTIDKFLVPLPENYGDFKEIANSLFSKFFDTKYICNNEPFKDLIVPYHLGDVYDSIRKEPFTVPTIEIPQGSRGYLLDDSKAHEAGYDAFITGVCFLTMWKYLGERRRLKQSATFKDLTLLKPYVNRVFLIHLLDDMYMSLSGEDPEVSKDHVFHLSFPKTWKLNDIFQLFSPFGNVHVSWIDDSSAYIGLYRRDQAAVALSTLSQSDTYKIMTYSQRQEILSKKNKLPFSPHATEKSRNKRKSGSDGPSVSKRRIETIIEEEEVPRKIPKTFAEDDIWE